jgi:ubiquinone/menaquinone biosynthesis C-methylase UbiE
VKIITHQQQQEIWEKEHDSPEVLLQMDSSDPSSGVKKFWQWLQGKDKDVTKYKGLEMGCGKGRSVIWLAQKGISMVGFDFSTKAIATAKERAKIADVEKNTQFIHQDATEPWNFPSNTFDFIIDCFATTDIESRKGREFATSEMARVVKSKGYILVYVMSTDDEFHKMMVKESPTSEVNAFLHHTTGKFEKIFTREEIIDLHKDLTLIAEERVPKLATFFGKEYKCNHHWMVFEKK